MESLRRHVLVLITCGLGLTLGDMSPCQAQSPSRHRTLWLPLDGQVDVGGKIDNSGTNYIATVKSPSGSAVLARSTQVTLEPGTYTALFQILHYEKVRTRTPIGVINVISGGRYLKQVEVWGEPIDGTGEYQRATTDFAITEKTPVTLEYFFKQGTGIWLGGISLHRKYKEIFNIGHRMNAQWTVDRAIKDGANGVEFDIHPVRHGQKDNHTTTGFMVYHYGDHVGSAGLPSKATAAKDFDAFIANVKKHFDSGKLSMAIFDLKPTFCDGLGLAPDLRYLPNQNDWRDKTINMLKASGLPLDRIVLSVPQDHAKGFAQAIAAHNLPCLIDSYLEAYPAETTTDINKIDHWINSVKATGAKFVGAGKDSGVRGEFFRWAYWLGRMVHERDTGKQFKKCYFWTVNTKYGMRQALDYSLDGVLTDYPAEFTNIINQEAPYKDMFTLAHHKTPLNEVFGRPNTSDEGPAVVNLKDALHQNSKVSLVSNGNKYLGEFYAGNKYYYPQLTNSSEDIQFNGGDVPLKYGDYVQIRTNNTSQWKNATWKSRNFLGAFKEVDYVYYYSADQGYNIEWQVLATGGDKVNGDIVMHGDKVRLLNRHFNQYLYPQHNKSVLSTTASASPDTIWTIGTRDQRPDKFLYSEAELKRQEEAKRNSEKPRSEAEVDLAAARYVLDAGGSVWVNNQPQEIKARAALPATFKFTGFHLANVMDPGARAFQGSRVGGVDRARINAESSVLWGLQECRNLANVRISDPNFRGQGIEGLAGSSRSLRSLDLSNTAVDDNAVDKIIKLAYSPPPNPVPGSSGFRKDFNNIGQAAAYQNYMATQRTKPEIVLNIANTKITAAGIAKLKADPIYRLKILGPQGTDESQLPRKPMTPQDPTAPKAPQPAPASQFNVILEGVNPANKLSVIKAIRDLTGQGLVEAKMTVEGAPKTIKQGVNKTEAEKIKRQLEQAGARVTLKPA